MYEKVLQYIYIYIFMQDASLLLTELKFVKCDIRLFCSIGKCHETRHTGQNPLFILIKVWLFFYCITNVIMFVCARSFVWIFLRMKVVHSFHSLEWIYKLQCHGPLSSIFCAQFETFFLRFLLLVIVYICWEMLCDYVILI